RRGPRSESFPDATLMRLASASALPSMRPRKLIGAPRLTRKVGSSGKIASLDTSLRRLASPSSQTTRGSLRSPSSVSCARVIGRRPPESGSARRSGCCPTLRSLPGIGPDAEFFYLIGTLKGSRAPRDGLGPAEPPLPHAFVLIGTLKGSRAPRDGLGPAEPPLPHAFVLIGTLKGSRAPRD